MRKFLLSSAVRNTALVSSVLTCLRSSPSVRNTTLVSSVLTCLRSRPSVRNTTLVRAERRFSNRIW